MSMELTPTKYLSSPRWTLNLMTARLQELKAEIQSTRESLKDSSGTVELDQARQGRLTRMDALQGQQMALEAARRCAHQLNAIDGALRRIESGDFGCCFVCGDELNEQRLRIDPTITRCLDCADSCDA